MTISHLLLLTLCKTQPFLCILFFDGTLDLGLLVLCSLLIHKMIGSVLSIFRF